MILFPTVFIYFHNGHFKKKSFQWYGLGFPCGIFWGEDILKKHPLSPKYFCFIYWILLKCVICVLKNLFLLAPLLFFLVKFHNVLSYLKDRLHKIRRINSKENFLGTTCGQQSWLKKELYFFFQIQKSAEDSQA